MDAEARERVVGCCRRWMALREGGDGGCVPQQCGRETRVESSQVWVGEMATETENARSSLLGAVGRFTDEAMCRLRTHRFCWAGSEAEIIRRATQLDQRKGGSSGKQPGMEEGKRVRQR